VDLGHLVAERFEITERAADGGMGTVFRARDRSTGIAVALKVLNDASTETAARFDREGRVLAEIHHPGIVGYVAHGTQDGKLWLAMDWIEGETLAQRLARGPLGIDETVALGIQIAQAVGAAHQHGLVHRDIKPSNLLLEGDRVKVVDFGIVQLGPRSGNTQEGTVLGTPGYMAPEQARGASAVDPRADVFSLGCVLFECLTGKAAFSGEHMLAILAKIILEDAPRVTELRADVPAGLADLIAAMLAKEPERRPADGDAAARALASFPTHVRTLRARSPALTDGEQRIVSVVLAGEPLGEHKAALEATLPSMVAEVQLEQLREKLPATDCQIERLADGTLLIACWGKSNARDQAAQAVHAAMALAAIVPDAVVVATGRGVIAGRWPVGEAIDRAARMLRRFLKPASGIRVDELTAGLLDSRYDVRFANGSFIVEREHRRDDSARKLCGVVTSCVGRDRELRMLEDVFTEVRDDSVARAVVVVGTGGVGKSRLRQELLQRLPRPYDLLIGRGDPMRAGSPFGLLAHALRWTIGLADGQPIEAQRKRIAAHVARLFDAGSATRIASFLGELVGVPAAGNDVVLQAARRDPLLMGDLRREAWLDWLRAVTAERPLVIVLEDLHLGDAGTVALIDAALRDLADHPILVFALARPELRELFPSLWTSRMATEIALGELSKKAAERLAREVLGDNTPPATIARIVERAGGNAFYLEELIRAVAAGETKLPETVLATVQARLEALAPDLRRVLRAGSLFGEVFSDEGVAKLVDRSPRDALGELVDREVLYRRASARAAGQAEYAFRHALVREAAYAMLTDQDRKLGHRLAGEWLEHAGESDWLVLAEHYERGDVAARAVTAYLHAAEQALTGNDFAAALARAKRGLTLGAAGSERAQLRFVEADAHRWRGELVDAGARAAEALADLVPGSAPWFRASELVIMASGRRADFAEVIVRARAVAGTGERDVEARSARVSCLCEASRWLLQLGRHDLAGELAALAPMVAGELSALEPAAIIQLHRLRAARARHAGDLVGDLRGYQAVLDAFTRYGDLRNACNARVSVGFAYIELGDYAQAERELRQALVDAERMWLEIVATRARQNLAVVLANRGHHREALELLERVIAETAQQGNQRFEAWTRIYLSCVSLATGDLETAAAEAELAATMFAETPPARAGALAALARARVRQARSDAVAPAQMAMSILEQFGGIEEFESLVWLALLEALRAARSPDVEAVARRARARLLARAEPIADPAARHLFLYGVPENALLLK
jgi:eukaryotic-like serine/threonine-protein kinase